MQRDYNDYKYEIRDLEIRFVMFWVLTSIIAEEGPFKRAGDRTPHADRSRVVFIHGSIFFTETPVPAVEKQTSVLKIWLTQVCV